MFRIVSFMSAVVQLPPSVDVVCVEFVVRLSLCSIFDFFARIRLGFMLLASAM